MATMTKLGNNLAFYDVHRNELAYAAKGVDGFVLSMPSVVQDATGMCFPPLQSIQACRCAADLLEQMMIDSGH